MKSSFASVLPHPANAHQKEASSYQLLEQINDVACVLNEAETFVFLNGAALPFWGYQSAEITGKSWTSIICTEDLAATRAALHNCRTRQVATQFENRCLRKDGRMINASWSVRWSAEEHVFYCVVRNGSGQAPLVQHSEKLYRSLVAGGHDLVGIVSQAGIYTYVGENIQEVLGFTPQDLEGRSFTEFIHPDDLPFLNHQFQALLSQHRTIVPHFRFRNSAGQWRWMETRVTNLLHDPHIQGLVINSRDITERKEAELELARSEQRFKALVQEGSDVIVIVDREGLFTYSSDSIHKILGYAPSEILHKNIFSFIHPEDISETLAGIERVKNNVTIGGVRHRFRHKDGSYRWLESKGTNHFDSPLVQGMIVNARDITEKVLLQQKLDSELRNKQKEITSAVIKAQESERSKLGLELHDNVNQVLTTVKLYNEMYLSGYKEDRSLLERSARYLQDCINEIRSISKRLSAPTLGKITLQDSIRDLVDSINLTNKLQIHLYTEGVEHLHIPEDLHLGIYRIIQESLNNIIKYAQASEVEIRIECNEELLNLLIRDNGKGFDGTHKSGGIGITNMKTRAENLNGIFELHTAAGEGCTIAVSFLI